MVGGGGGMGGGGESRKSSNVIQWSKIQRGDRLNFTLFSPKSSTLSPLPPQAINNDRSLSEALLWHLFGIELFAFFFPSDLITSQSSTLYWLFILPFSWWPKGIKVVKTPASIPEFPTTTTSLRKRISSIMFLFTGNSMYSSMFAIFNPVDRKMATIVRNRAKKAPGKYIDKGVHSL